MPFIVTVVPLPVVADTYRAPLVTDVNVNDPPKSVQDSVVELFKVPVGT